MERLAQLAARGARQLLELGRDSRTVHTGQELGHVLLRLLDGRREDVHGVLARELEDVLAEIGLHRSDPAASSASLRPISSVAIDFDFAATVAPALRQISTMRSFASAAVRARNVEPARLDFFTEASHVRVEVVDDAEPRLVPARAKPLRRRAPPTRKCSPHEPLGGAVQSAADPRVCELQPGDLAEAAGRRGEEVTVHSSGERGGEMYDGTPRASCWERPRRCMRQPGPR